MTYEELAAKCWKLQHENTELLTVIYDLIDFVVKKYEIKSLDDFTCPRTRKLAELAKYKFTN